MKKYYLIFLLLGVVAVSFQNCAPANKMQTMNPSSPNANEKADTFSEPISGSNISEFTYSPIDLQNSKLGPSSYYVNVNLASGIISKNDSLGQSQVQIPNSDLVLAHQVFDNAKICSFDIPPGMAVCMAYSMPNTVFVDSDGQEKYLASQSVCYQEYLCENSQTEIKKFLARYNINISF